MADSDIKDFSPTLPDTNVTVLGVNIDEGANAANMNNADRRILSVVARADFGTLAVKADTLSESTAEAGVTIDGLQIKDGAPVGLDGTSANDFLRLDGSAKIPAVDGSQLFTTGEDFSGTAKTLAATDGGKILRSTNAAAVTVTIPTNATVPLPLFAPFFVMQGGAGQITVAGAGGVTVESPSSLTKTLVQYGLVGMWQRATNIWVLAGRLG